ncbi:cytoplasmic dynein 2 intermediate chain 1 isoform X1 [Hydra vulgaris]|uniref:cytoplasmic dynein 2 intermediate chain 1 isoform X1 n=2 Tax=Hydra vulgaris TaxID=6087 RepID=UPI001F5FA789|nr:cytoplasmic dynein 2 intermediate chain 1-like isoform X1 [Hydra vulgaris]
MSSEKSKNLTWTEKELAGVIQNKDDRKHRSSKDKTREKLRSKEELSKIKSGKDQSSTSSTSKQKSNRDLESSQSRKNDSKTESERRSHSKPDHRTKDSDHKSLQKSLVDETSHRKKQDENKDAKHRKQKNEAKSHRDSTQKEINHETVKMEDLSQRNSKKHHKSRESTIVQSDNKSSSDGNHHRNKDDKNLNKKTKHKEEEETPVEENNVDDYNYDDDEFDEYDDNDFEEDDSDDKEKSEDEEKSEDINETIKNNGNNSKMLLKSDQNDIDEISKAIIAENERTKIKSKISAVNETSQVRHEVIKDQSQITKDTSKMNFTAENQPQITKVTGKMNFTAANQKQISSKKSEKTKQRAEVLLKLIQLDVREFDLFEMASLTEYELYMKKFGQSDAKQIYTQTNDDDVTQEVQTDDIEFETRWCQHSHDLKACGIEGVKQRDSGSSMISTDSVRLNKFLIKASKVCLSLLEELEAGIELLQLRYTEMRTPYSEGYVTLSSSDFLILGRNFCDISYSPTQTNLMLTAYGPSNVVKKGHKSPKGLLCVWNSNEPNKAFMLLTCESKPNSCCFSTEKAHLAFAGMEDGVLAVWDLREPESYHNTELVGNTPQVFRNATFTTAASSDANCFPIVKCMPLVSYASLKAASNGEGGDISFQLASLDENGSVSIWIVVEVENNIYDLSNINEDLGLSPKGKVKLVKTTVIQSHKTSSSFENLFFVTCMEVDPSNPNHIYIGTEQGEVLHLSRFGKRPTPKQFVHKEDSAVRVNAINISPWRIPYILVCYKNGSVRLYNSKYEKSILSWSSFNNGIEIIDVQWSRSKPSIFFAMDANSFLFIWDLLVDDSLPIQQYQLKRKDKRAIGFKFANDYSAIGIGTPGRAPEMAVVYGDGSIEVHRLSRQISNMSAEDFDKTEEYLAQFTAGS